MNGCSFPVVAGGSKLVIGHMLLLIYGWGSSLVVVRGTSYYMLHGASLEFHCRAPLELLQVLGPPLELLLCLLLRLSCGGSMVMGLLYL